MPIRHMFKPIRINGCEIPNRVVRPAHATKLGGGTMSDDLIAYHAARARGGVGLTVLEVFGIHPSSPSLVTMWGKDLKGGLGRLMDQVRPHGMRVFNQIWHGGHNVLSRGGNVPWSASDTPGVRHGVTAIPMTKAMIDDVVEAFAKAAAFNEAAGIDGVEVHGAHGYLIQQFMSPLTNFRTDAYGGSFENRTRFLIEVMTAVKNAVSKSYPVGLRLSPETTPGGMTTDDIVEVAKLVESKGLADFFSLSVGNYYRWAITIAAMHEPAAYEMPHVVPIKKVSALPVIVTGRFRTLEEADQVVGRGEADLVALNRATIADPDLVRKTREGHEDLIRPCIGCNQGCLAGVFTAPRIGCTVNVAAGQERKLSEDMIEPAASPKNVLVVGGGPAGMEAARVAALRGHKVILAEATADLGGTVNIAKLAPRRQGIGDITEWMQREIYRLGVDVRFGTYVEPDDVRSIKPDAVIIATGSTPRMDGYQMFAPAQIPTGVDKRHVVSSHDVLLQGSNRDWGKSALVFDVTGHYEAIGVTEFLLDRGLKVTFVTSHVAFAPEMYWARTNEPALERFALKDFTLHTRARVAAIHDGTSTVEFMYGGKPFEVPADTVVLVSHNRSNRELADGLADYPGKVELVGDALSPRHLQYAIRQGHMAARAID